MGKNLNISGLIWSILVLLCLIRGPGQRFADYFRANRDLNQNFHFVYYNAINKLGLSYAKLILAASSGVGRLSDQRDYYKFESESTG